jgi:hypothetical protein
MSSVGLTLPRTSEEDALATIITALRSPRRRSNPIAQPDYGYDLYIPNVIFDRLDEQRESIRSSRQGPEVYTYDANVNAAPYYAAAWNLCLRGVLVPGVVRSGASGVVIGAGFNLTAYGRQWLEDASGFECVPSEYGRFAQILAAHSTRYGPGYHSRAQEASRCYQAHAYYACCAMCGAAAESILLALAIDKTKDEAAVMQQYNTASGRSKIERLLTAQLKESLRQSVANYLELLKYWRDSAAHGAEVNVGEEEAFTSLMVLLRFAQFGDSHWNQLIT